MRPLLYAPPTKNRPLTEALRVGFDAQVIPLDKVKFRPDQRLHIVCGLQFGAIEIMRQVWAFGLDYLFCDRAYFGGGLKSGRFRITRGSYQKTAIDGESGRLALWNVNMDPWRAGAETVMVVPPSDAVEKLYGINWARDYMPRITAGTKREIFVSPKSDRDRSPILERLKGVHCVVTWTSNVAVDAICAGIPAITSEHCAAAPLAGSLAALDIENPSRPDREAWAESLAWGQFTLDEIASGFARQTIGV